MTVDELRRAESSRLPSVAAVGAKLALAAVGAAVLIGARGLGFGTLREPGPGLWPGVAGLMLLTLNVLILAVERDAVAERLTPKSWKVLVALPSLLVFAAALAYIGLTAPTVALMIAWFRWLGDEPWLLSILLAVAAAAAFHSLFVVALSVPFPPDVLLGVLGLGGR